MNAANLAMIIGDPHATVRLIILRSRWQDRIESPDIDGTLEYPEWQRFADSADTTLKADA